MSFLINHQTESSFTTTTQTSNNNQYPIAIANRISNLLKIDTKKMNQQPIEIKQTYTPTKQIKTLTSHQLNLQQQYQ